MVTLGYTLSAEEHPPLDLVRNAKRAEDIGFAFTMISDHYHPWIDAQGQSPFVWAVLGGIAQATDTIRVGTGVTCPTIRIHPAIIAQAAATTAAMMPGRFMLGVGSGENLNEHILGDRWPQVDVRLEMLDEAVDVIRTLWQGGLQSYHGTYYDVENARIYTLPDELPPILVAGAGEKAATLAGAIGDGLVNTSPSEEVVSAFDNAGGCGKPKFLQQQVCWAESEEQAIDTVFTRWPNGAVSGQVSQELPLPSLFEQAASLVRKEDIAQSAICGPDPEKYLEMIQQGIDAGFDHIYLHQVGPDQEGFFTFAEKEILPNFA
jgi:coenzyme F420-dependent glucose-6-phosphate dehydrogenase